MRIMSAKFVNRLFAFGVVVAGLACAAATGANAQLANDRLGGCRERLYLSQDQRVAAVALATLDDATRRRVTIAGEPNIAAGMMDCARTVQLNICNDKILGELMNPFSWTGAGAVAGGLIMDTRKGRPSVLGGLLGAGVVGMTAGVVKAGQCRRAFQEIAPAAAEIFGDWRLDTRFVTAHETRERVIVKARSGEVDAASADRIMRFIDEVSDVLAR